jgi:hypothetical protein
MKDTHDETLEKACCGFWVTLLEISEISRSSPFTLAKGVLGVFIYS